METSKEHKALFETKERNGDMKKTLKDYLTFCEGHGLKPRLVRAVIRQHGRGWAGWQESAPNMARYGISGGFDGFFYYRETTEFARRNRRLIADYADSMAADFGESATKMVQGFGCLGAGYSEAEIGRCLYGRGDNEQILNALAWFAAETCAHEFENWVYEAQG